MRHLYQHIEPTPYKGHGPAIVHLSPNAARLLYEIGGTFGGDVDTILDRALRLYKAECEAKREAKRQAALADEATETDTHLVPRKSVIPITP